MKTHDFRLILSGISELTPETANALFQALGSDIEFNMRDGTAYVEVQSAAQTLNKAIMSAIAKVEKMDCGIRVLRVESETANTIAKINAGLLQTTEEK